MKKLLLPFLILFLAGMGFAAATPTEDLRGPDTIITSVVFDLPPEPGVNVKITVTSDDTFTGGSNIAAIEWWTRGENDVDPTPGTANPLPESDLDNSPYNSVFESGSFKFDIPDLCGQRNGGPIGGIGIGLVAKVAALPPSIFIGIRSQDSANNWGGTATHRIEIECPEEPGPEPEPSIDVSVLSATLKKKNALENMLLQSNVLRSRFKRALHLACAEKLGSDGDKAKAAAETFFVDDIALLSGNGKNEFSQKVRDCAAEAYTESVQELIDIKCFGKDADVERDGGVIPRNGSFAACGQQGDSCDITVAGSCCEDQGLQCVAGVLDPFPTGTCAQRGTKPPKDGEFSQFSKACELVLNKVLLNEPMQVELPPNGNGDEPKDDDKGENENFFSAPQTGFVVLGESQMTFLGLIALIIVLGLLKK